MRLPFDRVLIVTEGLKTERLYFESIRIKARLPNTQIAVTHSKFGTEPRQVVDYALEKFNESKLFERVYAVFDRDDHLTWSDALNRAGDLDRKVKNADGVLVRFQAIPSVPCFEIWLLLHYQDVFAFGHRTEIFEKLRTEINGYEKGTKGIFDMTESKLPDAIRRARLLQQQFDLRAETDPYTLVHELVGFLMTIR